MGSSYNVEQMLREQARELYSLAHSLEEAAQILEAIRESDGYIQRAKDIKKRAKEWMRSE